MNRAEFESRVEKRKGFTMSVTEADWKIIEKVYTFHPSISETKGKEQIADLYTEYGMGIIRDMLPRAEVMQKLEDEQRKARAELDRITALIEETRAGGEI